MASLDAKSILDVDNALANGTKGMQQKRTKQGSQADLGTPTNLNHGIFISGIQLLGIL